MHNLYDYDYNNCPTHCSCIVGQLKVDDGSLGLEAGLDVVGRLAVVVLVKLLHIRLVIGFGEEALLVKNGQDSQGLQYFKS